LEIYKKSDYKRNMKKIKKSYQFLPILFSVFIVISLFSCGRKGNLSPNIKPVVVITSSYGEDSLNANAIANPLTFRQKIFWRANDPDGTVKDFAFRILNENGNPIPTPGYEHIDENGWVLHYQNGADENIPMENPEAQLTIWTEQNYAEINFPANIEGDSAVVTSIFELKCKDNNNEESDIVKKYFTVFSRKPQVTCSSSRGDIDGKTVGKGIRLEFSIIDFDSYVGSVPDYFEFKLERKTIDGETIATEGYGEWISTKNQDDVTRFVLNQFSSPILVPNEFIDGEPADSTFLIYRAVDLAGIISEPDTISFFVNSDFHPGSLIYITDTFLLGENHYVTQRDASITQVIPSVQYTDNIHYATPFWIDKNGIFTAINSSDLKIYLHWGWHGEYEEDDPLGRIEGEILDEDTNSSYYAEITYFDLRLDDAPYYYPPFPPDENNTVTDEDGKQWLRIPVGNEIDQETVLTGLEDGTHKFEMRVVDLQNEIDPTPAELIFRLDALIPQNEKAGILLIDDDTDNPAFAPEEPINNAYFEFFTDFSGVVSLINRKDIYDMIVDDLQLYNLHFNKSVLSPTDLQAYKLVVFHSDNQTEDSNIYKEFDGLNLYVESGGNLILSGGSNLKTAFQYCLDEEIPLFEKFFGIPAEEDSVYLVANEDNEASFLKLQFFVNAIPKIEEFEEISLELPSFVNSVTLKEGLGPVALFGNNQAETIFGYGCKQPQEGTNFENWDEVNDNDQYPSLEQFEQCNGNSVALRNNLESGKCYIFGFPLSFMNIEDVKVMMNRILSELE